MTSATKAALKLRRIALESAAKICEAVAAEHTDVSRDMSAASTLCAERIRAMSVRLDEEAAVALATCDQVSS